MGWPLVPAAANHRASLAAGQLGFPNQHGELGGEIRVAQVDLGSENGSLFSEKNIIVGQLGR